MKFRNEYEIRAAAARDIGGEVPDEVWELIIEDGYVGEVCYGDEGSYDRLLKRIRRLRSIPATSAKRSQRSHTDTKTVVDTNDARSLLRTILLANHFAEHPLVFGFRHSYLPNGLLAFESLDGWIGTIAQQEGAPTPIQRVPLSERPSFDPDPQNPDWFSVSPAITVERLHGTFFASEYIWLQWYLPDKGIQRRKVTVGGTLHGLSDMAGLLARMYPWHEPEIVSLILTGIPIALPAMRVRTRVSRTLQHRDLLSPARNAAGVGPSSVFDNLVGEGVSSITMEIDPETPPKLVAEQYRQAQAQVRAGKRICRLSNKEQELLAHVLSHDSFRRGERRRWKKIMEDWNQTHRAKPEWLYKEHRAMARDFGRAVDALQTRINWAEFR